MYPRWVETSPHSGEESTGGALRHQMSAMHPVCPARGQGIVLGPMRNSHKQTGVKYAQFSLVGASNVLVDVGVFNVLRGPPRRPAGGHVHRPGAAQRRGEQRLALALRLARLLARRLVSMEARWADLAAKEVPARLASMLLLLVESEDVVTPEGYRISTRCIHQATRQHDRSEQGGRHQGAREATQRRGGGAEELPHTYVTDLEVLKRASE